MNPMNTLCRQRWEYPTIDVEEGVVRICCRVPRMEIQREEIKELGSDAILNNPYLLERRQEMFAGKKHSDCHVCWMAEEQSAPSPRSGAWQMKEHYEKFKGLQLGEKPVELSIDDPVLRADAPSFIELQLGILCDLKCVYCWRGNSSSWLLEDFRNNEITKQEYEKLSVRSNPEFEEVFWEWFEKVAGTAKMVSFVGGEPTLSPKFLPMMEKVLQILKEKKSEAALRIVTNLNCSDKRMDDFLNVLEKGCEKTAVFVDVSMESFGPQAEFIRSGLRWNQFEKNMRRLAEFCGTKPDVELSISATINALCLESFPRLMLFLLELRQMYGLRLGILKNSVIEPAWLAPKILPPEFAEMARQVADFIRECDQQLPMAQESHVWSYDWPEYAKYFDEIALAIEEPLPERDSLQAEFFRNINKLEQKRGVNFLKNFEPYKEFFEMAKEKSQLSF